MAIFIARIINSHDTETTKQTTTENKKSAFRDPVVWATIGICVATAVSVGVGIFQWLALKEANRDNRNALTDVQRSFVTSYEIKIVPDSATVPTTWSVSPILENGGNTSATQLRVRILRFYASPIWQMRRSNISAGATNPDINEVAFDALPEASITLAPHAKISLATYVLTAQGLGMLRAGTLSTGIFGEAEYFDVFGKWHRTKFCYRLMGRTSDINDDGIGFASNIGAAWAFIPDRIETTRNELTFRLCKRNNCADEQCGEKPDRPFNDHPNLTLIKEYPPSLNPNGNKLLDVESRK